MPIAQPNFAPGEDADLDRHASVAPMSSSALGIVLGILVGLRHAFEPDHLTAVSTLVSDSHDSRTGALLGVLWGVGHTVALVVVGVILMIVGQTLPERAAIAFELGVAAMLLVLGVRAIAHATRARRRAHALSHAHSFSYLKLSSLDRTPAHSHLTARPRARWRPVIIGIIHGLAGSGALTAIVFARLPDAGARVVYMLLFGIGSIVGMAVASGVAGATLHYVARSATTRHWAAVGCGVLSIVVGILWSIPLLT
jgi:predicted membrane channel-forming protein YqfA (hemolysin III family)